MDLTYIEGINHLRWAEPAFIQVLLPKFDLHKTPTECTLTIEFKENEKTITRRITKEKIKNAIPQYEDKVAKYQKLFDSILLERSIGTLRHDDPDFPFRFASGGTLPILLINDQEYYCLFFRDVFPLGWNIANGGCDSLTELLDPGITIGRELSEELIILGLFGNKDYIYRSSEGKIIERPEFEMARQLWNLIFTRMDFRRLKPAEIDIDWIEGPDRVSTTLVSNDGLPILTNPITRCFVNITALDFSIEVDKVARIPIENNVLLLDGEITDHKILGRPIGLFEVNKTEAKLQAGETEFFPDLVYYLGNPRPGGREEMLDVVFEKHIPRLIQEGIREKEHLPWLKKMRPHLFRLCPITTRMIRRHATYKLETRQAQTSGFSVFVSYSTQDQEFVTRLYHDLQRNRVNCWYAPEELKGGEKLYDQIDSAIKIYDKLLLVLSEHSINSEWVKSEMRRCRRAEKKEGKRKLFPIRLVDMPTLEDWDCFDPDYGKDLAVEVREYYIPDFSNWKDHDAYKIAFDRLLRDLQGYEEDVGKI